MSDFKPIFEPEEFLQSPGLPSSEDHLFMVQNDWWNNACLNFCHDGLGLYAAGYKEAADLLVNSVEERRAGQDTLVYPVLFLYRQYLELALKDLIRMAMQLTDIEGDFPKHHKINHLWETCHKLLLSIEPDDSVVELKEIGRLICDFSKVDPTSMAFRYPEDKDGNPSLPGITHINLRNVREVIAKISVILTGAGCQIANYLQLKASMESEYGAGMYQ
ncbi:MAG: hypothetical protein ACRCU9_01470 [Iodobacter sp.]